jgi:Tat protein secretion system quality control protein TatD with DNase activity
MYCSDDDLGWSTHIQHACPLCREVARIKGLSEDEVMRITTENAIKLFPAL